MNGLERIAEATRGTKWEGAVFLVGGAVRDELLGEEQPPDLDLVLEGDAAELANFLRERRVSSIHPATYPRFGTALVIVDGLNIELATARRESYHADSRKPHVSPGTLIDDARRRDFTINTLLRNLHTGELIDLLGIGLSDLRARILRTPLDPKQTFDDDPLRMLRAVRFKNRFGLTPAPGLFEAVEEAKDRLAIVSSERIRDELSKMLTHASAASSLSDLMEIGLLSQFLPESSEGLGIEQGGYHSKDVWGHTLEVVGLAASRDLPSHVDRLTLVLGALFHDTGKPRTRSRSADGRPRFFSHERVGAEIAATALRRLRYPSSLAKDVATLVANHMRLGSAPEFTIAAARRLVRDLGKLVEALVILCECDSAAVGRIPKGIDFAQVRQRIADALADSEKTGLRSPVSGEDIMSEFGLPSGPQVGRLKRELDEAVIRGDVEPGNRAAALRYLRGILTGTSDE